MRSKCQRKKVLIGGCLLLGLAFIACSSIISKTFTIVFYIDKPILSTNQKLDWSEVDLTDNEDWEEHHDKIKRIDSVEFAVNIKNNESTTATGQIYISEEDSLTLLNIEEKALLVLDGLEIPPHETRTIDRETSIQYIRNYEEMREFVMNGFFYVYAMADTIPFDVEIQEDSLAVIVSFTAEN